MSDDEKAFGEKAWIYCGQHRRPHVTGWCTVSVRDKVGLGMRLGEANYQGEAERAAEKCRKFGLPLFVDDQVRS
jgi:thiamine monophosphate synthase